MGKPGKPGKREYVQVLRLLETFEMGVVRGAIQHAIDLGAISFPSCLMNEMVSV